MDETIERLIRKYALENAVQYGGTAKAGSVMGKLLAERPDLKPSVRELMQLVETVTEEVNALPLSEQQKTLAAMPKVIVEKIFETPAEKAKSGERKLPPLPNTEKYRLIHVRFCPNPDGALHLGGARAAILCDEYAKIYDGKFTLRFDDTDPRTKFPIAEAYNWIIADLEWLGAKWHDTKYQSDRLEIYYGYAKQLLEMGAAYVCTCKPVEFRKLVSANRACPCRDLSPREHLARWYGMLEGGFGEGKAVVRIKTDLNHPNPAVREWPALRIINMDKFPHPRAGKKYRVWPLFAFCCGIDDHDLEISHVIRGKEHLTNSVRQEFLYNYLQWESSEAIHYGRFRIVGSVLSKSRIREGIAKGLYTGWDDPRLGTLMAMRRRGFLPETVRQLILEVGPKPVDVAISWENVQALNRKLLDPMADRYFFVANPIQLVVSNVRKAYVAKPPLHPSDPKRGNRILEVKQKDGKAFLLVSKNDLKLMEAGKTVRLMGLFNITVKHVEEHVEANLHSETHDEARKIGAPLIHWLPYGIGVETSVMMPDASTIQGIAEDACRALKVDSVVQFERFGFTRVDNFTDDKVVAYYAHR